MHITVCVCTFKRPQYLERLLKSLVSQQTESLFDFSVVIVDNDAQRSAEPVVSAFSKEGRIEVIYCVEVRQNIALARNKAVAAAKGDYICFIDDDEFPIENWLLLLYKTCQQYGVDGVLGPVKPFYDETPPAWVVKGKFYDRPSYPTGFVIDWRKGRTGNTFLRRELFRDEPEPFKPHFRSGEDQDFFRRMIDKGHVFVWCHEALAYESVPSNRWKLSFMVRRALLRGKVAALEPSSGFLDKMKSALAVPTYLLALPFLLLIGQHLFIQYFIKIFDHLGKILGTLGLDPVREGYVTE